MSVKTPTIVVQQKPEGIKVKIDGAYSPEHALYMLAQAQCTIILNTDDMVIEETEEKDSEVDVLQQLPTTPTKEEEPGNGMPTLP